MLTETQPAFDMVSIPSSLELDPVLLDETSNKPQSFKKLEPIQIQVQIRLSVPTVPMTYPESAYQWLVEVLDGLIDFGKRHGHYGVIKLTKKEYQWLDDILEELICSVGENETHPLAPLMEFIIRLIWNYEQTYVPKLTELFPELAEEEIVDTPASENEQTNANTSKLSDNELAAHAFLSIGSLLYHGNRTEKAVSAYDKAIELNPNDIAAHNNRGVVRNQLGNHQAAITDFGKVIALDPSKVVAYYNRGVAKNQFGDHQAAIADFDRAIALGLNFAEVYCHRAFAKTALDKYDAAISDYDKVIALKPDFVEVYNILGILRSELGQYDKALADYAEAIRIKPDYAETYAYRGVLKAHLGRINKARLDFQKALELAKQQGNDTLKAFIEERLQELNNSTLQDSEN